MAKIIILVSASAAFVVYFYTHWLKGISFGYFAAAFAGAIVFNIVLGLIAAAKSGASLTNKFWKNAQVMIIVLVVGCVIAINWPELRLGDGILFVFAVVSWAAMIAR